MNKPGSLQSLIATKYPEILNSNYLPKNTIKTVIHTMEEEGFFVVDSCVNMVVSTIVSCSSYDHVKHRPLFMSLVYHETDSHPELVPSVGYRFHKSDIPYGWGTMQCGFIDVATGDEIHHCTDGPAVIFKSIGLLVGFGGSYVTETYYVEGINFNPHGGPSTQVSNGDYSYTDEQGNLHRDNQELPTVISSVENHPNLKMHYFFCHGVETRTPILVEV